VYAVEQRALPCGRAFVLIAGIEAA
jgi:hypothetical protein